MSRWSFAKKLRHLGVVASVLLALFSPLTLASPAQAATGDGLKWYEKAQAGSTVGLALDTNTANYTYCGTSTTINYAWASGSTGCAGRSETDGFTNYWTGYIKAPSTGSLTFYNQSDDGFIVKINGTLVIDNWVEQGASATYNASGSFSMTAGTYYQIQVFHHENAGGADARLYWNYGGSQTIIPQTYLFSTTVAPDAPTSVTASGATATSLNLSWTAPADPGTSAISDYTIQYSSNSGSSWSTFSHTASSSTSATVTGLTRTTSYIFKVAAVTTVGTGSYSTNSTAVSTAAAVPGAPTGLSATSNADAQSVVSWTAPSDNGGAAITSYKVEYSSDGTNFYTATTAATGTSYTVTGLTNGTTYTFRVSAINSAGTGSASGTTTATTKGTALTPVFGSPTFGNGTWTIPVTNYDAAWTWTSSATNSATVATPVISGSTITFTVTPTAGTTSALTVYAKRTGYFDGSNTSTAYYPGCNPITFAGSVYTSLKFTATTTCQYIAPVAANYDYLVVAGGGSGGDRAGGGGGAGGYLTSVGTPANRINLSTSQILTITVGAGGVGYTSMHHGANGQDSVLQYTSTITSKGGGGGGTGSGSGVAYNGSSGGSGGGADGAGSVGTAAGTPSSQGNNGGSGTGSGLSSEYWTGGGGGGAGGAGTSGVSANPATGGSGGTGAANNITGSNVCYAAGGGGGTYTNGTPGSGGTCSGLTNTAGAGSAGDSAAGSATANTGSGGGGSGFTSGDGTPGSGGSGIVVLRYATAAPVPTLTVTNQTTTGLTVNVTNYDANFTYTTSLDAGSGTAGTPVISGTNYAIPFTAVTAGSSLTVKVQASLAGATTGVATTSGTALQNSQTISFTSTKPSTAVVGGTAYTVTATATSTLAVTFSVDSTSSSVCALSGSTVTFQAAGTCQINANQEGNSQWAAAPQVFQSFTVGRGTQATLSVTSLSGTYGSTVALTYSGGTGTGAITFAVVAGGTATGCSITGTTLSYTSAGTCLVTVTQAADSNWSSATSTTATINIAKIAQTITFAQPANRTITSGTFTAVASTTASGQSVTVTSTTSGVCTVTNNVVTLVGLGACTLNADVATSTNYLAATTVPQTFTVSSVTVTLNANGGTGTTANLVISSASGANLTANAYKKNGFAFGTWNTIAAGGGTSYTNGQLVNFAADTTLYAQWVGSTYTVTFDKNYTGSTSTTGTYVSNGTVTLPTAPVRSGYTFNGWATASSGGTNVGSSGNVSAMTSSGLILNYSIGDSTSYNGSGTAITDIASQLNTGVTGSLDGTTYSSPAYTVGPPANLNIVGTSSQYIYSGNMMPRLVSGSVKYSFFTWVYPTANDGSIVDERGQVGGGWQDTQMQMVGGKPRFGIWTSSQTEVTSANALALNQWYYMGITYDGSTLRGYVNGVQVASTAAARQTTNTGAWYLALGLADGTGASVQGNFRLGAFHVYNVDLSVDNVLRNYKADCAAYGTCAGLTFYAQWTASTQTITYAPNNGTGTITSQTGGTDSAVTLASTGMNRTGYTLAGWNTAADGSGATYALGASITMPVGGLALYAQWTANSYTVTYNTQGGSAVTAGSYTTGGSITLPAAPTRANYSFAGWFLAATGGSPLGATYSPPGTAALTIYAQWTAVAVAPTFSTQPSASSRTVGQTATFTAAATSTDGGAITYQWYKGTTAISGATSATYSFVTTATTDAGSYKVVATNTLNGATATATSNVVALTMSAAIVVTTPVTGLSGTYGGTFSLDLTSIATGGTGTYTYAVTSGSLPGGATMTAGVISSSNLTAAGSFPIVVTVTDGNTATASTSSFTIVVSQASQTITFAQPANRTVTSGTFSVSGTSTSGSTVTFTIDPASSAVCSISVRTVTVLGVGACTITANATSTSNYSAPSSLSRTVTISAVTVTFDPNGGTGTTAAKSITSPNGNALTANAFVRNGYTFAGWSTTSGTAAVAYSDSQVVSFTADTTLYAQWTANSYTVTYNTQSGSAVAAGSYTTGGSITLPAAPNRANYSFAGWFLTATGGSALGATYSPPGASALTIYAQWIALATAPTITQQPSAIAKTVGQTATFTALATTADGGVISYQWYKGTTPISGATSATYSFVTTATTDAGSYKVVATNTLNGGTATTTSNVVTLTMSGALTVSTPSTGLSGTYGGAFSLDLTSIATGGTGTYAYAVTSGSLPGGATMTAGVISSSNLTAAGSFPIVVTVTDGNSATIATNSFTLVVAQAAQSITFAQPANRTVTSGTFAVTGTSTSGSPVTFTIDSGSSAVCSISSGTVTLLGVGACVITANAASTTNYLSASPLSRTVTVSGVTITFAANGGTGSTSAKVITSPSGNALTANSFVRSGYSFSGWSTTSGTATVAYTDAQVVGLTADTTLYAQWTANNYSVTYYPINATSGSAPTDSGTYTIGNNATVLGNTGTLARTGYTFAGWTTASDGSGTVYVAGNTILIGSASINLYAKWTANPYSVTYSATTSDGGTVPVDSTIYNISQSVSVRGNTGTLTRSGYTFAGWTVAANGSGTVLVSGDSYTVGSSNITFYAKWTAVPYTATYSASTATSGSVPTDASTYNIGGAVTVLGNTGNLQRTGYTFAGWTTAADGTGTVLTSGGTVAVAAANVTLYAKWTPINYSITYNSNNATSGSVPADATNYNIGQNITVRGNTGTLVRTGYSFAGWNLAADGTGTNYQSGNQLLVGSANVTLYAKWTPNTYTVSYNANGASGALVRASETYTTAGTAVTLPGQGTLAKTGYNFGGWATTPNGIALSGTYTTASNVTLYAVWTIKSVAINYLPGIAQGLQFNMFPANTTANFGTAISVGSGVDGRVQINGTSYDFAGWNDTNSIYQSGSPYTLGDTDVTFTAVWVPVYAVRYIFNGGTPAQGESSIDSQCGGLDSTCNLNQIITTNQAPYRAGYNFEGWIDQSTNLIAAGSQTAVTGNSYLYYASWTPVNYTVSYNADGGSTAPTQASRTIGQTFTVGNAVTKTGYSFAGWSDGVQVYGSGATYTVGTSNVSLTAQWTPDIYTVTYDWNGGHGTTTSDDLYTVGTTDLTLPVVGDHVKDGFNFNGWSTSPTGNLLGLTYVPTASTTLYAVWGTGSYVLTMNANGGTVASSSYSVPNGTAQTLPTPTRTHFHFDGWFDAASNGNLLGMGGDDFTPASSKTLYAHWTQDSLVGMGASDKLGNLTASSTVRTRVSVFGPNNTVTVDVPAGALPTGTLIDIYLLRDTSRAASLISGANTFLVNLVVSWLAGDGTVPSTATGVPVKVTIEDPNIKAGAAVYSLIGSAVTYLATATVDGQVTAFITDDPELVVAAVVPGAPTSVSATAGNETAVVSWSAPSTDGGSPITSYVVTSSGGQTCTATSSLSCTVSGLTNGTSYTFTVQAVNAVGNSVSSSASSAVTPLGPQSISFGALNNKTMGTGTVSLSAVATSGLQVAFSTSSTGYCSISGSVLTLVGAGPCTVVASQAGGSGYLAAQQVSQSFTIAPALTLATPTGSALAATYNTAYTLALTSSGGAGSSTFAVTSGSLPAGLTMDGSTGVISGTPTAATSANLSITVTDANSATATASFTINVSAAGQSALTITTTTGTFGTPLPLFASGGSSTGSVSFAVVGGTTTCTLSGSNLSTTGAGTCLVTATRAADSNYSSVSSAPTTVTINKASQAALTLTSTSGTYLTPLQLSVSGGSGLGAVTYAVAAGSTTCTVSAGQLSAAGAGTCLVTATKASDDNYLSESSAQTTVNFAAANQTALSITSLNGSFGVPLQLATSGGSGLGNVSYVIASGTTTCSLNGTLLSATGAGSCLVTATKAADANFNSATSTQASVSFGLGTQSAVNLTSLSGTYLTPLVLTANGGSGNGGWSFTVANGTTGCSFDGTSVTTTGAGTCLVTATRAADSNFNAQLSAQTTVTFGRASQTISFSAPQNKTLGMSAFAVSATSTSSLPVSFSSTTPGVCAVTSGTVSLVAAGSCVLQADQAGNANYSSANAVQRSFTVSPALTIATPSAGLNGFNTVPFVLTLASSGGAGSNTYAISSGTLPTGLNLDASTGEISGTASSASTAPIVVSVTDANGAVAHTSSFTIVISQLSQATFTLVSLSGTYGSSLQLSAVGGSGNGAVSYVIAAGTTTCTLSGTTLTAMGAGTCLVTATKAADGGYASVSTAATTVTFGQSSQAALSMTSGTGTALTPVTLNATGGSGTGQINYSVTNGTATCALVGAVLTPSTAGTCSVTATNAGDANYTQISATPVTYTFALATQAPLSVSSLTGTATVPLALTTTGGSGTGAISFSVASGICTLANGSITATAAGTCLVTATKAADAAYSQVASAQATITFSAAPVVAPPAAAPAPVTPPVVIPTVNIPAKPETWVAPEVAPVVTTGQNVVVVNDVVTTVSTSVTADKQGITVVTPDWQFSLKIAASASPSATPADAVSGTQLVVSAGATVAVAGEQFQAGTQVKVWLRSTPQLLGLVTVNPDGSFASSLPIPAGLEIGNHTLVLQGLNNKNELQNAQASLLVKEPGASTATTSTVKIFFPVGGARVSFVAHRGIVAFMHAVAGLKNIVVTTSTYYLHASSRPLALKIGAARSAVLMQQLRRAGIAAKVVTTAHQTTQRSQVGQLFDVAITASAN